MPTALLVFYQLFLMMTAPPATITALPQTQILKVGERSVHELSSNQIHPYTLSLDAGQYFNLRIEGIGIDVVADVYGPDQKLLEQFDSPTGNARVEVSVVAAASGEHRIEIRSLEPRTAFGRYVTELREVRQADSGDLQRFTDRRNSRSLADKLGEAVGLGTDDEIVERFREAITELARPSSEPVILSLRVHEASQTPIRYALQGKNQEAASLAGKLFGAAEGVLDSNHPLFATILHTYINIELVVHNYDNARKLLPKAASFIDGSKSANSMVTISFLNLSGQMALIDNDGKRAEETLRRALLALEQEYGLQNDIAGKIYTYLGVALDQQRNHTEAETFFRKAIALHEDFDSDGREMAVAKVGLSLNLKNQGKFADAQPLAQEVVATFERRLGSQHPDTAIAQFSLAIIDLFLGQYVEADRLFARALQSLQTAFGNDSPQLLPMLRPWIEALRAVGRNEEAARYEQYIQRLAKTDNPNGPNK